MNHVTRYLLGLRACSRITAGPVLKISKGLEGLAVGALLEAVLAGPLQAWRELVEGVPRMLPSAPHTPRGGLDSDSQRGCTVMGPAPHAPS